MKNSLPVLFFSGVCLMAAMTECFSAEKTTKSVQKTTIENKEKSASFRKEINEQLNKWKTDKKDNNFQIQQLKVMLDKPELSESDKFYIRERIAVLCSVPEDSGSSWIWSRVPHETFDRSAAKRELEAAALPALRNPSFTSSDKIILAEKYVWFLGDENRFAEAEEFALNLTKAQDFKNPHDQARAWILLSNVCRWQDKYEDAMNAIRQGMKTDALYAVKAGCKLAAAFNRKDDAAALWAQLNNPYEELVYYFDSQGSDFGLTPLAVRDARLCNMANRFVRDPKNNAEKRMEVAKRYCFDRNNPGSLESLRILNASIGFKSQKAAGPFASNSV